MMAKRLLVIFMHYSQQESRQNGLFFIPVALLPIMVNGKAMVNCLFGLKASLPLYCLCLGMHDQNNFTEELYLVPAQH